MALRKKNAYWYVNEVHKSSTTLKRTNILYYQKENSQSIESISNLIKIFILNVPAINILGLRLTAGGRMRNAINQTKEPFQN